MPSMKSFLLEQRNDFVDSDLWAEACLGCDSTDNHGNGLCASCDD